MQENTSRARLPAWIFFALAMIAVIGFVVFQQNRPSDVPPEASVQPPEQPVNKAIEAVKDPAAQSEEIADAPEKQAIDTDETPPGTESALESGALAGSDNLVDQSQAEAANDDAKKDEAAKAASFLHLQICMPQVKACMINMLAYVLGVT